MMLDKYVGIPFEDNCSSLNGADCYGLIRLVYAQELGINIPEFLGSCYDTKRIWSDYLKQISEHWELVEEPNTFDVVAMAYDPKHPRIVQHFGIYIGNGKLLQSLEKIGSFICELEDYRAYTKGFYRWKQYS